MEIEGVYLEAKNGRLAVALINPLAYETNLVIIHSHSNNPDIGCCL